jgi:DNA replication and repair protein RecF
MINRKRVEPLSLVIGKFPIVIFSPEHGAITMGGPAERRKFLDLVISQSSRSYFQTLLDYRNVLKQRNRTLLDMRLGRAGEQGLLEAWNEQLIRFGTALWQHRKRFLGEFEPVVRSVYRQFVDGTEDPAFIYRPLSTGDLPGDTADVADSFALLLKEKENEERRLGTTLVGPHRDEVVFTLDTREIRPYASQGQHKTFIVSLKLAEFLYLKEQCNETPLLMLDDVFAELDDDRTGRVIEYVENVGQAFLTSTNRNLLEGWKLSGGDNRHFFIEAGAVADQRVADHV